MMSVDFFEDQDKARRITGSLVFYFILGMLGITIVFCLVIFSIVFLTVCFVPGLWDSWVVREPGFFLALLAAGILLFILLCSRWKIVQLKKNGGHAIAELLGGRLVQPGTHAPLERRLLNVVDEMAIASGITVPVVYVLPQENGINAFAAGLDPHYAVLGVTRGSMENLTRDELQGIIGHEFSHILNGDMRLNLRLIGWIHGITAIGLSGSWLFYTSVGPGRGRFSHDEENRAFVPGMLLGALLMAMGYLGTFFGDIIKASICRQREYLADASAVEFTRNPAGLAGALKKIGGFSSGSGMDTPKATVASHMFFSQGVLPLFERLLATHPPLVERIKRIDPEWAGKFEDINWEARRRIQHRATAELSGVSYLADPELSGAGTPTAAEIQRSNRLERRYESYKRQVLSAVPKAVFNAARVPSSAPVFIYALLLSVQEREREASMGLLSEICELRTYDLVQKLVPQLQETKAAARIPLLDVARPHMQYLDAAEYTFFRDTVRKLICLDNKLRLFEWVVWAMVRYQLDPFYSQTKTAGMEPPPLCTQQDSCAVLLAMLSTCGERDRTMSKRMFVRGAQQLRLELPELWQNKISLNQVDAALSKLEQLKSIAKKRLMAACVACVCENNEVSIAEGELLRAIGDRLGCPPPPLLPGQPLD